MPPADIRVLHVIAGLETGGAETMLATLATRRPPGLAQSVATLIPGGAQAERIAAAGIPLTSLGMRRSRPTLGGLMRLARLIRATAPDIVQGWMYHADLAATLALHLSGRRRATRLAWNLRCSDMAGRDYGLQFRLVRRLWLCLAPRADLVLANSQAGLDYHRGLGLQARRSVLIPNGIDVDRFRPDPAARARVRQELGIDPAQRVIVHVARVDPMKDHATLLAAAGDLAGGLAGGPAQATLLLVGRGTEALSASPGVRGLGVRGLGERRDVPDLLAAADLIVSSSAYGEGFSNALAEGMAAGLPAVATDAGDARAILGDTGIVCPIRDPQALAGAIGALLAEAPEAFAARGRAARARIVDQFSLDRCVERFTALYREIARPQ